ncbi:MAG: ABC-F family ATP-binding cassette domain-containing protein [Eubacterium sp.]|nr:ABC-F family ATP-binding cassette domain-containing protein [Eubacterium sp.]
MILSCQHIQKSYGVNNVLKDITFLLEEKDRAALVGINGAGKSTLLHILCGKETADSGEIVFPKQCTLGLLSQYQDPEYNCTVLEEVRKARTDVFQMEKRIREIERSLPETTGEGRASLLEEYETLLPEYERRNGYAGESEITGVLRGLGFSEEESLRPISSLSGGQKARVSLARLLLEEPSLLLLDEPTNHLDLKAVSWLEERLRKYPGTLLLVSHDRYFLDRIVGKVIGIENGVSSVYNGNYTDFRVKRAAARDAAFHAWEKQQAEIRHQEEVIRKLKQFNREKSLKRARSREKQLDKTILAERPSEITADMKLSFPVKEISGQDVLTVTDLSKGFTETPLFREASFYLGRGDRIVLIGGNGIGKSTILKLISGRLKPDTGEIRIGSKVTIGYYDQEQQMLHEEKTLFQEISDAMPSLTETKIRNTLAAFLFTGDDVFRPVSVLSGGERARLCLARLMLSGANLLLLDEPTNHLDIVSREILEDALCSYDGTVLCVSHDRYFIDRIATGILELEDGHLLSGMGNYSDYMEKKASVPVLSQKEETITASKTDWLSQKEQQAAERRHQKALRTCEEQIASLEERDQEIDALFLQPEVSADYEKCRELTDEQTAVRQELERLYGEWEKLAEES